MGSASAACSAGHAHDLVHGVRFVRMIAGRSTSDLHLSQCGLDDDGKNGRPEAVLGIWVFVSTNGSRVSVVVPQRLLHLFQVLAVVAKQQLVNSFLPWVRLNEFLKVVVDVFEIGVHAVIGMSDAVAVHWCQYANTVNGRFQVGRALRCGHHDIHGDCSVSRSQNGRRFVK